MKKLLIAIILSTIPLNAYGYVGKVIKATGRVEIVKKGTFKGVFWKKINGIFNVGDIIRTKRKSKATVNFIDKSSVTILENSRLIVEKYIPSKATVIKNPYGKVIYRIARRAKGKFIIKTPIVLIGVKGTEFFVSSSIIRVTIVVNSGSVEVKNLFFPGDLIKLKKGEMVTIYPIKKHFYPQNAPEKLLKRIFSKEEPAEKTELIIKPFEEKKEDVIEEMNMEKQPESKANFNIAIPDTSIEGL
ncbi:FecR family protein [Desulfurobacterium sp.]